MKFRNPANNYVEVADHAWLWALVFGAFYFASKGIWRHFFLGFLLAIPTFGLSWLVYACCAPEIVASHYGRMGFIRDA